MEINYSDILQGTITAGGLLAGLLGILGKRHMRDMLWTVIRAIEEADDNKGVKQRVRHHSLVEDNKKRLDSEIVAATEKDVGR